MPEHRRCGRRPVPGTRRARRPVPPAPALISLGSALLALTGCGGWAPSDPPAAGADPRAAELEALGYLDGYEPPADDRAGVTVHDPARAWQAPTLVHSSHEPSAWLMDMDGRELHRWSVPLADTFPEHAEALVAEERGQRWHDWRRVHLLPDGSLLAIYEGLGLLKLDPASRLVWAHANRAHHDLQVRDDGTIVVLSRVAHVVEGFGPEPVLEDLVLVLDADGRELDRFSVVEALRASPHADLLDRAPRHGDPLHTNGLALLDGTGSAAAPFLAAGHVLLSLRNVDALAVIDPRARRAVWAATGPWRAQHDPTVQPDGTILLFDNRGRDGHSRVMQVDPASGAITWAWPPEGSDAPFQSKVLGAVQRLPNGNTLATESDSGRAVEVTPDGTIVWEYRNPARVGEDGALVANLLEVQRVSPGPEAARRLGLEPAR